MDKKTNWFIRGAALIIIIMGSFFLKDYVREKQITSQFLEDKRESDPFVCVLLDYCQDNNLPLINVSTQGTLVIGDLMRDYFLTSIEPYVEYELNVNFTDLENWNTMCPLFVDFVKLISLNSS